MPQKPPQQQEIPQIQQEQQKKEVTPDEAVQINRMIRTVKDIRQQFNIPKTTTDLQILEDYMQKVPDAMKQFDPNREAKQQDTQMAQSIRQKFNIPENVTDQQIIDDYRSQTWETPENRALKWMPIEWWQWWMLPRAWRVEPTFKHDWSSPHVPKMIWNVPSSWLNVVSDVYNMFAHPYQTAKWLMKMVSWAWVKIGKSALRLIEWKDNFEQKYAVAIDNAKQKWWIEWWIAEKLETNEEMAWMIWDVLKERYWSSKNIAKTMTEDPLWMISDIVSVIEWWSRLSRLWLKTAWRVAPNSQWIARAVDRAWEIANIANDADPYFMAMQWWIKWIWAWSDLVKQWVKKITWREWWFLEETKYWAMSQITWLPEDVVRIAVEEADIVKSASRGDFTAETLIDDITNVITDLERQTWETGRQYQKLYGVDKNFDWNAIRNTAITRLEDLWIKLNESWKVMIDPTKYAMKNWEKAQIQQMMDILKSIENKRVMSVEELHNIRKNIDTASNWKEWVSQRKSHAWSLIRDQIDTQLKKIPEWKKLDAHYAKVKKAVWTVKDIFFTRKWDLKKSTYWQLKWNFLNERYWKELAILEQFAPGISKNIKWLKYVEAMKSAKNLKPWQYTKSILIWAMWSWVAWPLWFLLWWLTLNPEGVIKIMQKLSKREKKLLLEVSQWKKLSDKWRELMWQIESKLKQQIKWLPEPKASEITPEWVIRQQNPIEPLPKVNRATEIKETGQSNIKQPKNTTKEIAEVKKKEKQQEIESKKNEIQKKYDDAPGEPIKNVSNFKKWMITKDWVITETWFNTGRSFYQVEWDWRFQYRYQWEAKSLSETPAPKVAPKVPKIQPKKIEKQKKMELSELWWVKTVKPNNQLKFNQWEYYEAVRLVVNDKDAMVARYWALANRDKQSIIWKWARLTDWEKLEMKQILNELWVDRKTAIERHQFLKDEAKRVRSSEKQVLHEIKDDFRDKWEVLPWEDGYNDYIQKKMRGDIAKAPKIPAKKTKKQIEQEKFEREMSQVAKEIEKEIFQQDWPIMKRILQIETMEQNVWKVGRNKKVNKAYSHQMQTRVMRERDRIIERIREEKNMDQFQASDEYDRLRERAMKLQAQGKFKMKQNEKIAKEKWYVTPSESKRIIGKYFTEKEVPTVFRDKIATPRWQEAYWKYHNWAIELVRDWLKRWVPEHEAFHAYFDMFTEQSRKTKLLDDIKKKEKVNSNIEAEEIMADWFADYVQGKKWVKWYLKSFFKDVREGMKSLFWKEDKVRRLYKDIENRRRPGSERVIRENSVKNKKLWVPAFKVKEASLIEEARKYKSAEEFIKSIREKRIEWQRWWSAPSWYWETLKDRISYDWDVTLREELTKHIKQPNDYFHWYLWPKKYWNDSKTITAIKKWMKDWEIKIYRAVPEWVNNWRDWDWVYFVKDKAISHWEIALDWKYKIIEKKTSIDNVWRDWNDINEWWFDDWSEANKLSKILEEANKNNKKIEEAKFKVKEQELVALHNLTKEKLVKIKSLWWSAMPSIWIVEKSIPFEDFWDITLIWNKELIESSWSKIYSADAYTPRVPEPTLFTKKDEYTKQRIKEIAKEMDVETYKVDNFITNDWGNREHMMNNDKRRNKYVDEIDELVDKKIFKWFTYLWNRRYTPYTMDNIIKEMKSQWKWNESSIFSWNLSQMMWKASKKLTVPKVKKIKFWKSEDIDKMYDQISEEYLSKLDEIHDTTNGSSIIHRVGEDVSDARSTSPRYMQEKLNSRWYNVTFKQIDELHKIINKWLELPKSYVEAKIERGVSLDEFSYALVPEKQMKEVQRILEWTRLKDRIIWYKEWEKRVNKIQEIQKKYWNVFFWIWSALISANQLASLFWISE